MAARSILRYHGDDMRRIAILLATFITSAASTARGDDHAADARAFFEAKVRPVLVDRCYSCHSDRLARPKGDLRLDTKAGVLKGGANGPVIVPGRPDDSPLIERIAAEDDESRMPPKQPLAPEVIADLRRWVAMGALDPRDGKGPPPPGDSLDWWSLRPIVRATPPDAGQCADARNAVDLFILAKLREKGLDPAPEADRRTLARRLSFDLLGLPPSPEEVAEFEQDPRPDAYERLVDRLLASPHYGERWARHWMDAVHFAETHGHDQDRVRPNAWPYRDYLIAAFNRDVPYRRFIEDQIAGDVLHPKEPHATPALGFLAAGPWDESSLRDIREDSLDRTIGHYLDRDDVVTTTMATFVSSTVHCARCHDHKFDPISQEEYYGLQAVFAGIGRADRAYDPDPAVAAFRRGLVAKKKALAARTREFMATLLDDQDLAREVVAWESRQGAPAAWTVLDPETVESSGGATLAKEPDRSIYSSGARPAQEVVTLSARIDVRSVTALRLEVLPDERLPMKGPGRNDNGNLHLTEFTVSVAPSSGPEGKRPVTLRTATADFDQAGWPATAAIDGDEKTAWGIYPEVGKPHQVVFETAEDLGRDGDVILTIVMKQTTPPGHPIGRFRLSATNAARPVTPSVLPDTVAGILRVAPALRSDEQRRELAAYVLAGDIKRRLADLPAPLLVFAGAADFAPDGSHKPVAVPRTVHVLERGDVRRPGREAFPGAMRCVSGLATPFPLANPADEGTRRASLAAWIADDANPLTWRSIANRAWQHHFGRGLVDTPNDFGRMGSRPTHPELLDYLAAELRNGGGSQKRLHRLLVTSATYRRSSRHNERAAAIDGENRLLWRQNRRKLDAESIRDAMLSASGRLDESMGGPSVRQFTLSSGVHVTPVVDYGKYDWDAPDSGRRSIYRFLFRTLPDPFVEALDGPDASQLTPVRIESASALQALALLNDRFVIRQAEALARRLEAVPDAEGRLGRAFLLCWGREPSPDEYRDWSGYVEEHGLTNACRLLFNCSESLFVD
jgi:hypothetical protein